MEEQAKLSSPDDPNGERFWVRGTEHINIVGINPNRPGAVEFRVTKGALVNGEEAAFVQAFRDGVEEALRHKTV